MLAYGLDIGRHIEHLQLHHIELFFLQHFSQSRLEILRDEALHMVRLLGEQVEKSLQWLDAQVDVDKLYASLLPVILGDVAFLDVIFLVVDGQYLDLMPSFQQTRDDAVHRHGTAF